MDKRGASSLASCVSDTELMEPIVMTTSNDGNRVSRNADWPIEAAHGCREMPEFTQHCSFAPWPVPGHNHPLPVSDGSGQHNIQSQLGR
jgi:hypothetical protein